MLFNSIGFFIFLPICFLLHWYVFARNLRARNAFILFISYIFYGWWDWRYLALIIFCSLVAFICGILIHTAGTQRLRKLYLTISIVVPLSVLVVFKYYDFFVTSLVQAVGSVGIDLDLRLLHVLLPVGISFYTFQALSYTTDIYRREIEPTRDLITFLAFKAFFPQLVAGPIERATNLLPQFKVLQPFDRTKAYDGMRQMLWGLFKKVVVADTCAIHVNAIFADHEQLPSATLLLGAVLFAIQIYGDFSGYSDIAIGCARLFGFSLMRNFAFPYFSRDMAEFWRRWHISLSTWFRDYVYVPLGGSRGTVAASVRNTFIIFIVSGFWHGANWTFIIWGALNAVYFLPLLLLRNNRRHIDIVAQGRWLPSVGDVLRIGLTFLLTCIAWVFFRSATVGEAWEYLVRMFSFTGGNALQHITPTSILLVMVLMIVEWIQREHQHGLHMVTTVPKPVRWSIYTVVLLGIVYMGVEDSSFIYFQF